MNAIRLAVLAAMLASGTALAQDPNPPSQQQPSATEQAPATEQTPSTTEQMPSTTTPSATDQTQAGQTQAGDQSKAEWPEFSTLDKNGDGSINRDEAREQSMLSSRFGEMDGDGDGALSSDEYQKGREQYNTSPNQ